MHVFRSVFSSAPFPLFSCTSLSLLLQVCSCTAISLCSAEVSLFFCLRASIFSRSSSACMIMFQVAIIFLSSRDTRWVISPASSGSALLGSSQLLGRFRFPSSSPPPDLLVAASCTGAACGPSLSSCASTSEQPPAWRDSFMAITSCCRCVSRSGLARAELISATSRILVDSHLLSHSASKCSICIPSSRSDLPEGSIRRRRRRRARRLGEDSGKRKEGARLVRTKKEAWSPDSNFLAKRESCAKARLSRSFCREVKDRGCAALPKEQQHCAISRQQWAKVLFLLMNL
eukprot:764506-Hanusia_phi.AAC.5